MKRLTVLLALMAVALTGCRKNTCVKDTLLLDIKFGSNLTVTRIDFAATYNGTPFQTSLTGTIKSGGTVEVRFPADTPYQAGATLSLTATATTSAGTIVTGPLPLSLIKSCLAYTITLGQTTNQDLAGADLTGADLSLSGDLAGADLTMTSSADLTGVVEDLTGVVQDLTPAPVDMVPPADMAPACTTEGALRCNDTDHRKQQRCTSGQWVDQTCATIAPGTAAQPPVFACTTAKNACVDTGWVQWSLVNAPPSPRFTTSTGAQPIVTDALTGLQWQLKNTGDNQYSFADAKTHCATLAYGGFIGDWRIPSRSELNSIVDRTVTTGAPTPTAFAADTDESLYWTSSPLQQSTISFFSISFVPAQGYVSEDDVTDTLDVRCVR